MRISDWSSDVCSSDLNTAVGTQCGCHPVRGYAPGTANRSRYGSATYGSKALAGTSTTCTPSEYGPTWYGGNTKRSAVMRPAASSTGSNWLKLPASAPEPSSIILSPDLSISARCAGSISSASMRCESDAGNCSRTTSEIARQPSAPSTRRCACSSSRSEEHTSDLQSLMRLSY